MHNLFCNRGDIHNEADVEALFVEPLLKDLGLGYPNNCIKRKASIEAVTLPTSGSHGERYRPDYVLMDSAGRPVVVVDAKSVSENISDYRYQVTGYALLINQRFEDNPVRYCLLTNSNNTELLEWDREQPVLVLRFVDFHSGNDRFVSLRSALSYNGFNQKEAIKDVSPKFHRPTIREVTTAFEDAHNIIWKKEKIGPTKAFYELSKLLFVKLKQDRSIHDALSEGGG